ncbi:MAG TPA: hypothetical protein VJN18_10755 [Polyangiaceae bacterium]|nr:hypothetical protein [Polyangiaceae bacterium]
MRRLTSWAVVIVAGLAVLSAPGCLTSQDSNVAGVGDPRDPPVSTGEGGAREPGGGKGDAGKTVHGSGNRPSGSDNDDGGADGGCNDDADCALRADNRSLCSAPTGDCVDCLTASDCESNEECVDNDCRRFTACGDSGDCPQGLVCNSTAARCVECVGSSDCAPDESCSLNVCRKRCSSDGHCSPFGLRCDTSSGYCASCVSDSDCPETRNCQQGTCVRDICTGGAAACQSGSLATCNAAGSMLSALIPCEAQQTCTEDASGARCAPWICLPSTTGCSLTSERVVTCSDDGLSETLVEDCTLADQLCIGTTGGICSDQLCEPSMLFCQGNTVQLCDATGATSSLNQTCPTNQLCNPATVACAVPLCTPSQPACDGNVFTTCNAEGFGYTGARTDCAALDEFCGPTGCTTSQVDTIPSVPTLYSGGALANYAMLNFYSVTGSRNLALIEQYMSPASATTLTWHVYESLTQTGTYTSISNTTTTSTTGTGYQASGALAVPLVAGRFYAIGVSWTTPALLFGYQTTTPTQVVSFGSLISATVLTPPLAATIPYVQPSSYFLPQRLTTAP